MIKTYFDLITDASFRDFTCDLIKKEVGNEYSFDLRFPKLYRYRRFSEYSIGDIINENITLSSISEFNDAFDGAIHLSDIKKAQYEAYERAEKLKSLSKITGVELSERIYDDIINGAAKIYNNDARLKFRLLDYLGTYVCCFSESISSTLMWSYYADSSKGICIEYDFNNLPDEGVDKNSIFPVAYTDKTLDLERYINDNSHEIYDYSIDVAVLCAALNKSKVWQYENEWRIVWVWPYFTEKKRRLSIGSLGKPTRVILGYHFLKNFFVYEGESQDNAKRMIKLLLNLITYLKDKNIPIAVMKPDIGSFSFVPCDISLDELYKFINRSFMDGGPELMQYYYVIQDRLMDILEGKEI